MIATSQFTISVVNDGQPGATGQTGPQGTSVNKVVKEYRLSDSSTELTGSGTGYTWSETKPQIPSGKYLWERERTDLSNNTSTYGTAHCDIVISGLVFDVDNNTNAITSKVWESDITTKINAYDLATVSSIRNRVTQTEADIDGISTQVLDISTTTDGHGNVTYTSTRLSTLEQETDKIALMVSVDGTTSSLTLTQNMLSAMTSQFVVKDPAGSATIISGGQIVANSITTAMLATDAIKSSNYTVSSNTSSPYSATGTYLNLTNGNIYTPNFGVSNTSGKAYLNGEIIATSGSIGNNSTNYWEIGNYRDYNLTDSAVIKAHGSAYIQAGYWQLSNDKLNTQYYTTGQQAGVLTYYKDSTTNTYFDVGQKIPSNFAGYSASDSSTQRWNKAWFYGRKYTGNSVPSYDSEWTYFFEVDSGGNVITTGDIYEGGTKLSDKYAAITDVGSAYLPKTGGTITGDLIVNGAFTTNLLLQTNLGSTSTGQLTGNANATVSHGVTGTLGVSNGGTGKSQWEANRIVYASATNALSQIDAGTSGQILKSNGSSAPGWVNQSSIAAGSATNDSDGNAINATYRKLSNDEFDTIDVTELTVGDVVVNGSARFVNGLIGNLTGNVTGNASTATKVGNTLKIQINGGTTEGTNQFTYDGSAAKTVNISKSSIGLVNVENTAISTWTGSSNLTTSSVGTFGAAATKGVDSSIASGSTSTNLPTSASVAAFVEGKNYVNGLSSGTTSGHLVLWGANGHSVSDGGVALGSIVSSVASNQDGKLVLTYADGTTSQPIEVSFVASSTSSVAVADSLNVNGVAIGSSTTPVYFTNQGAPTVANSIPTLNNSTSGGVFYAPTTAGTSGNFLKSSGSGAPTWSTISKTDIGLGNVDNTADANKTVLAAASSTRWTSPQTVYVTLGTASTSTTIQGGSQSAETIGVNGTLGVDNGGTGKTSWTQYGLVYASNTNALSQIDSGTSGQILVSGGSSAAPSWVSASNITVGSATSATQDGVGNVIASTYVNLTGTQTISGTKTFSAATSFTNTTASTSKTTGAVKVSGGVGVAGRVSANEIEVNNGCVLQFDSTLHCLNFVFN